MLQKGGSLILNLEASILYELAMVQYFTITIFEVVNLD